MKSFGIEVKDEEESDFREKEEGFRGLEKGRVLHEMKRENVFERYIGLW